MWLAALRNLAVGASRPRRRVLSRRPARLRLERLDERALPTAFTAGSVADLIADINAANLAGGSNTIALVAGAAFQLSAVNNIADGATGLPVIAANNDLTILGNADTVARSTAAGTPAFRLFDVAVGGSLTMTNLTLQGGLAFGSGAAAQGGAVYNRGTLNLSGVTVQQNTAQSTVNYFAELCAGGGIYSDGALTLQSCTIQNNLALGGDGTSSSSAGGGYGDAALGGGVAVMGGTANLVNVTLISNTAQGGNAGKGGGNSPRNRFSGGNLDGLGGAGLGGGVYVGGASATLTGTVITHNDATGGSGVRGQGGGIYIHALATVYLDGSTLAAVNHNHASTSDPNVYGSFTLI